MRFAIVFFALVALLLPLPAAGDESPRLSKDDVLTLLQNGFSEELIVLKIQRAGVAFEPTVAEMIELKAGGATERILEAILANRTERERRPPPVDRGEGMVLVPAGPFQMGAPGSEDFSPEHTVSIDAFFIDRHEVTNAEYERFDPAHRRDPASDCDDCPVTNVSWNEAEVYARSLGKRLPTEAEWEKAARGPEGYLFAHGEVYRKDLANVETRSASIVERYPANGYGVYDMLGNVWEWCADAYVEDAYRARTMGSPIESSRSLGRVVRGGSFRNGREVHAAVRTWVSPSYRYRSIGFRCVKDVPNEGGHDQHNVLDRP